MTMYVSTTVNRDYQGDRMSYETDDASQDAGASRGGKVPADVIYCQTSDTGWPGNTLDSVQQALAAYDGDDIWADVITRLDSYDAAATALLAPICADPVFVVVTGTAYQWCPALGLWQAVDVRAEIEQAMTDPLTMSIASGIGGRRGRRGRNAFRRLRVTFTSFYK
jgi:hypothetical protein